MITNILIVSLVISVVLNILIFWYVQNLVKYIKVLNTGTKKMLNSLEEFGEHLTKVYNMDIFYGDNTLQSLLEHSDSISEEVREYLSISEELLRGDDDA